MISFTLDPTPTLYYNDEIIHGINILDRLHQLAPSNAEAANLFLEVASMHQVVSIPRIGFRLENEAAVMPTKRMIDVGYDLTIVQPLQTTLSTTLYETFVSLDIPLGFYVELVPRSSIYKTGYSLANSVGIIDPGYTGTVKVPLTKVDPEAPDLELPARIAQLIVKPYIVSEAYDATEHGRVGTGRGSGGFGSTG